MQSLMPHWQLGKIKKCLKKAVIQQLLKKSLLYILQISVSFTQFLTFRFLCVWWLHDHSSSNSWMKMIFPASACKLPKVNYFFITFISLPLAAPSSLPQGTLVDDLKSMSLLVLLDLSVAFDTMNHWIMLRHPVWESVALVPLFLVKWGPACNVSPLLGACSLTQTHTE